MQELIQQVLILLKNHKKVSTAFLQRRLNISYDMAEKIMKEVESKR